MTSPDKTSQILSKLAEIKKLATDVEGLAKPSGEVPGTPTPLPEVAHDDNHTAIKWTGPWEVTPGSSKYGGSDHNTGSAGAIMSFSFVGTRVTMSGVKDAHHGTARVTISTKGKTTSEIVVVNQKNTTRDTGVFLDKTLPAGEHSVTLHVTGDGQIAVDSIGLTGTIVPLKAPDLPSDGSTTPPANSVAITRKGNKLYRGSEEWWFVGYNSFVWSGNCGHPQEKMSKEQVESWFTSMRHDGHGLVRLFFYAGWNFDRMDHIVAQAKKHNIYLIISLDDAIAGCGESEKNGSWFSSAAERNTFRKHLEDVLTRYKGEPMILALEYFNEPGKYNTWQAIRSFYDEMGKVRDKIDPTRLMMSGTVAPYWLGGESNFKYVHESSGIDIASMHEYDQDEAASNHTQRCINNSAGKPLIVGEFGIASSESGAGCKTSYTERAKRFQRKVDAYLATPGCSGALAWAWQPGQNAGTCSYGTLDRDAASQAVLRNAKK